MGESEAKGDVIPSKGEFTMFRTQMKKSSKVAKVVRVVKNNHRQFICHSERREESHPEKEREERDSSLAL